MKILLISPASGGWRQIARRKRFNGKAFRFSMLSLLTLAELSPEDAELRLIDEQVEEVPLSEAFDLVGITAMTATAPRAYELASLFRARGIPVVLGGFHPTLNPDEAGQHADAVVVGSAYGAWEQVIEDAKQGRLQKIYHGDSSHPIPKALPRHLMQAKHYATANATFATLGCRNRCGFCSISAFHGARHYARTVEDVIAEVKTFRQRFFMFVDDNLTQDREYARELLAGLAPLHRKWVTQVSVDLADDEVMLRAMRKAGCVGVFVGLETFNASTLENQDKAWTPPERYREAISNFHRHGLFVEAGIIFGFPADRPETFRDTLRMLDKIGIDAIQASILTPLPGTGLFEAMKEKIFDRNWEHYDYRHVVHTPEGMTPEELQGGADWVISRFYSPLRLARRALRWLTIPGAWRNIFYALGLSLAYYGRTRSFGISGFDPAGKQLAKGSNREFLPAHLN